MILQLSDGTYLHTAYAISNIAEEFTEEDWSLTSQEGMDYIGTYIDGSSAEGTDPTLYNWEELLDTDIDDTDSEGEMPVADYQAQLDALQDQVTILQNDSEDLAGNIEVNANNVATVSELSSTAQDLAMEANQVAQATGQHFWTDTNGVHISNEEAIADGDRNTIFNTLGMLFRKGANNLLAILAGGASGTDPKGLAIYDGAGNADENIVASFTDEGSVIGKNSGSRTIIQEGTITMVDANGSTNLIVESSGVVSDVFYRDWIYGAFPYGINTEATLNIFRYYRKPPNGTIIELRMYNNPSILSFTVGTSSTETISNNGSTCSVSFDGDKILTFIPSSGSVWYPEWVTWTAPEIAPCYTFGNRSTTDVHGDPITDANGGYSMTIGRELVSTSQYWDGALVVGQYNTLEHADNLFVVGNGGGKATRNDAFRVDGSGNAYVKGDITATNHVIGIVETGTTSNNWDYRLWSDGTYEAWRSHGFTGMALTSSSAGTYYGGGTTLGVPNFPNNGNTGVLQCICSENGAFSHSSGVYLYQVLHSSATTPTANMTFQFRAHKSTSNAACGIDIYLRGTYT